MPSEGSRANVVIWVVAAVLALFAVVRLTGSHGAGGGARVQVDSSPAAAGPRASHDGAAIYVHVAGAVRRPGLLKLASGSRVATAGQRAGGAGPPAGLSGGNPAGRLGDGQQGLGPGGGAPGGPRPARA